MANILSIAQSGLNAAQIGMATTAHNIANQATPGYSRQVVIQTALSAMSSGGGYAGIGTSVQNVQRIYNSFLATQTNTVQSSASQLSSYYTQISKINNMVADSTAGLAPVLQSFFSSVQDLVNNPSTASSRQALLSGASSLASRFQTLNSQLESMSDDVNAQISASITNINSYAQQIAKLNQAIAKAQSSTGQQPNDLLDQRDYLVSQLAQETKISVVKQDTGYGIFFGNGQPLVVGSEAKELSVVSSTTDAGRLLVGYTTSTGAVATIPETAISGGNLGGLFAYRSNTLDTMQNALGRIAISLATTFNAQHKLGQDQNGTLGTDFFNVASPQINAGGDNSATAAISATFSDVSALTTDNYRLSYDGTNYRVTRLPDNVSIYSDSTFPTDIIEGVTLTETGAMSAGDEFLIRPTADGAADFSLLIKDTSLIAAAAPIVTSATTANSGTASISQGSVNSSFTSATLASSVTLTYDSDTGTFTGFPSTMDVTVTVNGTSTTYAAGDAVPYTDGATISFGGAEFAISGTPADGDTFTIGANVSGTGDNRNMLLLGDLQTQNTMLNGTTSFNGAYSQIVSLIGNKTKELQVTSEAEATLLGQYQTAQQSESGVNLDEEATNLLRYQQAYQAAGKVMQAVSDMFDTLIALGS